MNDEKKKSHHGRFVRVKNTENVYFNTQTNTYYLIEMSRGRRLFKTTGVKGKAVIVLGTDGKYLAKAESGLGAAKTAIAEMREFYSLSENKRKERPTFTYYSDLTLEIQKTKSHRTYVIALDGDKNLRPFFEVYCPYLDNFEANFEVYWARYQNYQAKRNPGRKLGHDRKYLIMVLRRAFKQKSISSIFIKADFPLNETIEPIGRALEDWEVRQLLFVGQGLPRQGQKIYRQIMIAVHLGLRKNEILKLQRNEVNLRKRHINLNPEKIKTRKRRLAPIPIHDDVFKIIVDLMNECSGKYLFPKLVTTDDGLNRVYDWDEPQTDLTDSFMRVKAAAGIKCRFHDLRHTAITNMCAANIPVTTISKVMGCSIELINKIYDHLNKKTQDELRTLEKGRFTFSLIESEIVREEGTGKKS